MFWDRLPFLDQSDEVVHKACYFFAVNMGGNVLSFIIGRCDAEIARFGWVLGVHEQFWHEANAHAFADHGINRFPVLAGIEDIR